MGRLARAWGYWTPVHSSARRLSSSWGLALCQVLMVEGWGLTSKLGY